MSSAAGLSAAKRRRGAGASQQSTKSVLKPGSSKNVHVGPQIPGNMPPIGQLLYVHEERLRRLEKLTESFDAEEDDSGNSDNRLDRQEFVTVVQAINTELGKMKQMVSDLQSTVLSNASAIKSASDNVKDSVIADVTQELNNVSLKVEDSSNSNSKKKKGSSSDSN